MYVVSIKLAETDQNLLFSVKPNNLRQIYHGLESGKSFPVLSEDNLKIFLDTLKPLLNQNLYTDKIQRIKSVDLNLSIDTFEVSKV